MGLTGPKGDNGTKGDKGDTGPAGQGSLRVVDAKGNEVGMYVGRPQPGVIREVNGTFVEIPLNGSAFASCSTASASCIMYSFEEEGCTGTAYLQAGDGLTQDAIVADDGIFYPSGPVATLTIKSIRIDAGRCIPTDGTQPSAVMKWAPLSSLGFTAPFHVAK